MSVDAEEKQSVSAAEGGPGTARRKTADLPSLAVTLTLTLVVLAATTAFNGVIERWAWYPSVLGCVLGTALGIAASRFFRLGPTIAPFAGVLGTIISANLIFFPTTALLGFIPSAQSIERFWELIGSSRDTISNQVAPVTPEPGAVFLVAIAMSLLLVLMDTLTLGMQLPLTAGLGVILAWVTPAIIKPSSVGMLSFVLTAAAFLIFLATTHWYLQARAPGNPLAVPRLPVPQILAIGAGTLAIAVVLPLLTPGFNQGAFPQGSRVNWGQGNGLNPYVTLGADLRSPAGQGAFTYETTASQPPYMRSSVIADYSGERWGPDTSDEGTILLGGNQQLARSDSAPDWLELQSRGIEVQQIRTRINAGSFTSPWLLAPFQVSAVGGLTGNWRYDVLENTFRGDNITTQNLTYEVSSVFVVPTPEQVNAINPPLSERTRFPIPDIYQQIPENIPGVISETARAVVDAAGARTPFDQAVAIQQYLRGPDFSYSEQAPVDGNYDGSGLDVIEEFLSARSGYCVHFAGTMAVMLRTLGMPTRIAVGFTAGTASGEGEEIGSTPTQAYEVAAKDAHAWPEVYFNGVGWLPFEPTPSRGVVPEYAQEDEPVPAEVPDDSLDPQPDPPVPVPDTGAVPPEPVDSGTSAQTSQGIQVQNILGTVGMVVGAVLVLLLPFFIRTAQRSRRSAVLTAEPGSERASLAAWRELRDTAADYGRSPGVAMTPREYVAWLGASIQADDATGEALHLLGRDFEERNYARPESGVEAAKLEDALGQVRAALDSNATTLARTQARFLPRSLFRFRR